MRKAYKELYSVLEKSLETEKKELFLIQKMINNLTDVRKAHFYKARIVAMMMTALKNEENEKLRWLIPEWKIATSRENKYSFK